jgi:glycosyltransferase involved in cell wall biosynthesis
MAAKLAVIGTPVGGIPDFIRNNETGLLCEPGNPEDIAKKIKILLTDKELYQELIDNSFKMAREEYDWDKISEKLRRLYAEAIDS